MLLCWSLMQIILPDPVKILLHEVVDANLSSRLQESHQVIKGVVEVREFLLIIIQVVNHKIASNKVKLFFILVDLSHVFKQRPLNYLNILDVVLLLFLSHLRNHSVIDFERNNLFHIFTDFKSVIS